MAPGPRLQQLERLRGVLADVLQGNAFYRERLRAAGIERPGDLNPGTFSRLPFTTKVELSDDQQAHPPFGRNLTFALDRYVSFHQTSGTTGAPLRCLDTADSWLWWLRCWGEVYAAAGVTAADRIFFPFSFGPFIGFWSAFEASKLLGALTIPGGAMSSYQRLRAIVDNGATVVVCTPTYALHLLEVAREEGIDLAVSDVRVTIHAGEPGASIPATKRRIEQGWGARCYDHAGATEVGAWGFECSAGGGLHVNENEFILEVIDPASGEPSEEGELVLTNLGRAGFPVIRYRTGDHVRLAGAPCACGRDLAFLDGGVLGRIDDCLIIRGVNVFPSAIENFVRAFPEIGEFAVNVYRRGELDELEVTVELEEARGPQVVPALLRQVQGSLGLRPVIKLASPGTLPRFELKARRVTDSRIAGIR